MSDVVKILAGSHLYGCPLKTSDYDYKKVYIQSLDQLLYDRSSGINRAKNEEENSEEEAFPLAVYMQYLLQGQVITVDMLFAPDQFVIETSDTWKYITSNKDKFFSSSSIVPFAKYAKSQAYKYGDKKAKLESVTFVKQLVHMRKDFDLIVFATKGKAGISVEVDPASGIRHLNVCGKKFGETTDLKLWYEPLHKLQEAFGERVKSVTNGVDLKASYHALRIIKEAIELTEHGTLTFPRPEKDLLLAIRRSELSKDEISTLIEDAFDTLYKMPGVSITNIPKLQSLEGASKQFVLDTQYKRIVNDKRNNS